MSSLHRLCPNCHRQLDYDRIHAGFSDLGYMYCDSDETVVTWETYDKRYALIVDKHPWMLNDEERTRVEAAIGPCPYGGRFRFANLPRCPHCGSELAELASDPIYFVILGRRLDATKDGLWRPNT